MNQLPISPMGWPFWVQNRCLLHWMFKFSASIISILGQQKLLSYFHGSIDNVLVSFPHFLGLLSSVQQSLATCGCLIKLEFSFNNSPLYWPQFQYVKWTHMRMKTMLLGTADKEYSHHPRKFFWSVLAKIIESISEPLVFIKSHIRNSHHYNSYKTVIWPVNPVQKPHSNFSGAPGGQEICLSAWGVLCFLQ